MSFRLLPAASADIDAIGRYIALGNPQASRQMVEEIMRRVRLLGEMPGLGSPRFEIKPGLRVVTVKPYNILYLIEGEDALILRVVHGARRWERLVR